MKSPAFQVYVNDFLGSAKVGMMSTEEIGAYWLLLFLDWQEIGFVFEERSLSRWCRLTPSRFKRAWVALKPCFVDVEGRLMSPRLQKEREKQAEWRAKSAKGGRKSGEARAKGGSQMVEPTPQPNGNTPLPLPLQVTTTATTSVGAANGKRISWTVEGSELWGKSVGPIAPARFGKSLKPVVDKYGWPEAKAALECYIEMNEGKTRKVEWFADDFVRWDGLAKMPCVDPETSELTEKGRMAYYG